ncbi:formimidoylglutamase [Zhouia sp. PK063]|uniref:formimidoylglutamase n=1 Tax=Zhouia sp. PK063 TaxID=3373602 RepID=UPI00379787E1
MLKPLIPYTLKDINPLINYRKGETKFGEKVDLLLTHEQIEEQINSSLAKYVLIGIPEDAGVIANFGRPGARNAWQAVLKTLVNIQNNSYLKPKKLLILGHLDYQKELNALENFADDAELYRKNAKALVKKIDDDVTYLVQHIVKAGKKPIVVGGGHNNAYGILKGCAIGHGKPLNAINIDAHTDFRPSKSRHSGNGFSCAYKEGFLNKYFIFGIHENYTPAKVFDKLHKNPERVQYNTFEEIEIRQEKELTYQINTAMDFIKTDKFGIEIDCDAIKNIPSSAMTSTGFSIEQVRRLLHAFSSHKNASYLHICEAAPNSNHENEQLLTGKLITTLITDFLKK